MLLKNWNIRWHSCKRNNYCNTKAENTNLNLGLTLLVGWPIEIIALNIRKKKVLNFFPIFIFEEMLQMLLKKIIAFEPGYMSGSFPLPLPNLSHFSLQLECKVKHTMNNKTVFHNAFTDCSIYFLLRNLLYLLHKFTLCFNKTS